MNLIFGCYELLMKLLISLFRLICVLAPFFFNYYTNRCKNLFDIKLNTLKKE